jgi:hypothetical protein
MLAREGGVGEAPFVLFRPPNDDDDSPGFDGAVLLLLLLCVDGGNCCKEGCLLALGELDLEVLVPPAAAGGVGVVLVVSGFVFIRWCLFGRTNAHPLSLLTLRRRIEMLLQL